MNKTLLLIFLGIFSWPVWAQIDEDFSDGNFSENPEWIGNADHFIVNDDFQLQLNQEGEAGASSLGTPSLFIDSTCWEFDIRLAFSPSSNNNARVYLTANEEDLQGDLNGYFLQFGESGSSDAIELFKQNGSEVESICRGTEAAIASSFSARIKVVHRLNGDWLVYSDFDHTGQFYLEANGQDNTYHSTSYFGFVCTYTSSNATKFYFDNIKVVYYEADEQAPEVTALVVRNPNELSLSFNEAVSAEAAANSANYLVNYGIGSPISVELNQAQTQAILYFSQEFVLDQTYQITINNISDLSGNIMSETQMEFRRSQIQAFDVVFNEIMADPSPSVGLPDAEFLEIYNNSLSSIDLNNWILKIGESEKTFPNVVIEAQSYLILCKQSNISQFLPFGLCVGFSSFSLTNSGQDLYLFSPDGSLIHQISYTQDWYKDSEKDDGGWTIAQINPQAFCVEEDNWKASESIIGGTPGTENIIFDNTPMAPEIKSISIHDNPLLLLSFNQHMDLDDLTDATAYEVSPDIGLAQQVSVFDSSTAVFLRFDKDFEVGVNYTLSILKPLRNCVGESMTLPAEASFVLSKIAEVGDVVINEIMADPDPAIGLPPYEYLELFNNASAPIDLSQWSLQLGSSTKTIDSYVIPPQSFVIVCSTDAESAFSEFGEVIGISGFSLANTGAQLVLRNNDGAVIHEINYKNNWYEDESKAQGGWSLEAIESQAYCLARLNFGESVHENGGSPGDWNSLMGLAPEPEDLKIQGVEMISDSKIRILFTQKMDSMSLANAFNYAIEPEKYIENLQIEGPQYTSLVMSFEEDLEEGQIYTLSTLEGLLSCSYEDADGLTALFAIPDEIEKGDMVFNEVLFDAAIDQGEYIELVNVSDKILETSKLSISRLKINTYDTTWYTAHLPSTLLFPMDYMAYTKNAAQVLKVYYSENPERIISMEDFLSLPNDQALLYLHLASHKDSIIDQLSYEESWHYSLLNNTQGVSLEKISFALGNVKSNWHSAASQVNYGTPAYQNSQFQEEGSSSAAFELQTEIFSPDNDGVDDVLQINYKMKEAGFTLNLMIYDARGRQITHLVKNELLGQSGSFFWNGASDDNEKCPMGIYLLYFEYFDLNGQVKKEKRTTVLGGRL